MLGETIREHRKARDWTQQVLADKAGISQNYLSDIEKGARTGTLEVLQALADALDLTLELRQAPDAATSIGAEESAEGRLDTWATEIIAIGPDLIPAERVAVLDHARALRDRRGRS